MIRIFTPIIFTSYIFSFLNFAEAKTKNFINDISIFNIDQSINVVIEIPAGTIEKWKVTKSGNKIKKEIDSGKFRKIDYLAYPFNYGFVPQTILPVEKGGDGDPLDVLVIGSSIDRGSVIKVKPIGSLILLDNGQIDTKILALSLSETNLSNVNSIQDLKKNYLGLLEIIILWFQNYKGEIIEYKGILNKRATLEYINKYHLEFKSK